MVMYHHVNANIGELLTCNVEHCASVNVLITSKNKPHNITTTVNRLINRSQHKAMNHTQPTSNIPATGFTVRSNNTIEDRRLVSFNKSATFTFNNFALLQILHGRILLDKSYGMSVDTALAAKLGIYAIESATNDVHIELNRKEMQSLRLWLEARMAHCEKERDMESGAEKYSHDNDLAVEAVTKFNPDTYIAQKFLLLDLREWLAGDVID